MAFCDNTKDDQLSQPALSWNRSDFIEDGAQIRQANFLTRVTKTGAPKRLAHFLHFLEEKMRDLQFLTELKVATGNPVIPVICRLYKSAETEEVAWGGDWEPTLQTPLSSHCALNPGGAPGCHHRWLPYCFSSSPSTALWPWGSAPSMWGPLGNPRRRTRMSWMSLSRWVPFFSKDWWTPLMPSTAFRPEDTQVEFN